jgi:hypothetical protein
MLGFMKQQVPGIDGLNGDESNPDTAAPPQNVVVQPTAAAQAELNPDPDHSWVGTNVEIFGNELGDWARMHLSAGGQPGCGYPHMTAGRSYMTAYEPVLD